MLVLVMFAKAAEYVKKDTGEAKSFGEVSGVLSTASTDKEGAGFEMISLRTDFETASQIRQSVPALYELSTVPRKFRTPAGEQMTLQVVGAVKVADMSGVAFTPKSIRERQQAAPRAAATVAA